MTCQHQVEAMDSFHHLKLREEVYFIPDLWTGDNLTRAFRCPAIPFKIEKKLFRYVNGVKVWNVKIPATLAAAKKEKHLIEGDAETILSGNSRGRAKYKPCESTRYVWRLNPVADRIVSAYSVVPTPYLIDSPLPEGIWSRRWIKRWLRVHPELDKHCWKARRTLNDKEKTWLKAHLSELPKEKQQRSSAKAVIPKINATRLHFTIAYIISQKYEGIGGNDQFIKTPKLLAAERRRALQAAERLEHLYYYFLTGAYDDEISVTVGKNRRTINESRICLAEVLTKKRDIQAEFFLKIKPTAVAGDPIQTRRLFDWEWLRNTYWASGHSLGEIPNDIS